MKHFMLLHVGFEMPTPEIMVAWRAWFTAVADRTVQNAGLRNGREISLEGAKDLPMNREALTGYTIVKADSIEEAQAIAESNPFVSSIRIYELASH